MRVFKPFAFAMPLIMAGTAALADPPREHRRDGRADDKRAVRDVVGEVEQHYRGHVIDVQPPRSNDDMYRVRVLQEGGRVKTLRVPAKREQERNGGR